MAAEGVGAPAADVPHPQRAGAPATPDTAAAEAADPRATLRLMTLLSPAFPVGAFSYSHGIERAVHDGLIASRADAVGWIGDLLRLGSGWNDALLFAEAWRSASAGNRTAASAVGGVPTAAGLEDLAELAAAMAGSAERHMETVAQGTAFLDAAVAAWPQTALADLPLACAYPVAAGAVARAHGVPLHTALAAFMQAFAANLVQACVRLVPLGQRDGVAAVADLEPLTLEVAGRAAAASLDDLGSATILSDLSALRHETQYSRLFRS